MTPNPSSTETGAPLVLDGEKIALVSVKLDGVLLTDEQLSTTDQSLTITEVPQGPFTVEIVTICNPQANTAAVGPLSVERHLLHAMRGGGLPPHHLFL